jgi:cytochrome P450
MTTHAASTHVFDPFSPEVMANPLPFYRELRDYDPVHYNPQYDAYFLSRFEDVYEMLSTPGNVFVPSEGAQPSRETLLTRHGGGPVPMASKTPFAMLHMQESPTYEIVRQAHIKPLRPGGVKKLADFVREVVRDRLDLLVPRGRFDLTQHYGGIVAASVQCYLFRFPLSEAKHILDTVNAGSRTDPKDGSKSNERFDRMCEIVQPLVTARRRQGPDGTWSLMDGMFEVEVDGRGLTDREIAETVGIIMLGGTETVPKIVGHGLWELYKDPDQLAAVRADPAAHAGTAFREMVRYCAPAQWFVRTVHEPVTIGGVDMEPGKRVIYLIPAAARDPREYGDDADDFRWDRTITRWVNFGHGQHFCMGYHLALLEGSILVEEFLKRVPDFKVVEAQASRPPSSFQWGWNELPIVLPGDNAYQNRF